MDVERLNSMVWRDDWAIMLVSSSLVYGTTTLKSDLPQKVLVVLRCSKSLANLVLAAGPLDATRRRAKELCIPSLAPGRGSLVPQVYSREGPQGYSSTLCLDRVLATQNVHSLRCC
jgi:hypothetical protein